MRRPHGDLRAHSASGSYIQPDREHISERSLRRSRTRFLSSSEFLRSGENPYGPGARHFAVRATARGLEAFVCRNREPDLTEILLRATFTRLSHSK
jgi:hypothetical protein